MEFITARVELQVLNDQYLYNKSKTGDNDDTYWECMERRSGNECRVRITLNQHEVFLTKQVNAPILLTQN